MPRNKALHKAQKVIVQYKLRHATNVAIGHARIETREFMAESFVLSRIFGGSYGY
jgi:hypothetical protein